ncbi:NepR family anti-sigma factor [Methylosinus trichosporium]|uniref:Anti-sigma factor NepR domain-containing protein n=2 Tax=Methylocystaceae TaxID=31993 RepID=A0A2D2D189_METT3|nr:NepR family anti-sigma factor [Methylosinus trichosporium]ATQ68740.1 hypothetical protein CQW49_13255 [Methylosinus trichosporium OB3b]OBS53101.1 hypothetical protein A8B73_07260 [Methylosinus sp. 3S-1]
MGKSSRRTNAAAALSKTDSRGDREETPFDPVVTQEDVHSAADHEGLVVLNSRRPQERSPRSSSRRDADRNKIGEQIGDQLRDLYNDVLEQPVPERFLELLNQLEADTISSASTKAPGEG